MTVRRYRGLRISDEHHARLRDLKQVLDRDMCRLLEDAVDAIYSHYLAHPVTGPILQKLQEVRREVQRAHADGTNPFS